MEGYTVHVEGMVETLRAFQGLERDFARPAANKELRAAAGQCAGVLAGRLQGAAGGGTPQAPLVARSVRIKSDRLPAVSIGGATRVGRYGAPAGVLLWGSEHGGHHFPPGRNNAGYWIRPTVEAFKGAEAVAIYRQAVAACLKRWHL